jgi:hypothetical protein
MRDEDCDSTEFRLSPPARRGSIALEKRMLRLSVQRSGWFVEHQKEWLIARETTWKYQHNSNVLFQGVCQ